VELAPTFVSPSSGHPDAIRMRPNHRSLEIFALAEISTVTAVLWDEAWVSALIWA